MTPMENERRILTWVPQAVALLATAGVIVYLLLTSVVPNAAHLDMAELRTRPVLITAENIPDQAFRTYILAHVDSDGDGRLSTAEREAVTSFGTASTSSATDTTSASTSSGDKGSLSGLGITNLQGIELFPNLKSIVAADNALTSVDITANTALRYLDLRGNASFALTCGSANSGCQVMVDRTANVLGDTAQIDVRYV